MPTQKTFKRRVRARMTRTGESYTAARHRLLAKGADSPAGGSEDAPTFTTSDEAMQLGSGRSRDAWFSILDEWRAAERRHPEIARWLQVEHGVGGWWAQTITVDYERARGLRAVHQMQDGYSVGATRTIGVAADRLLGAFTDSTVRQRWLPDIELGQRPTRAAGTARFDWSDPPSRIVVMVSPKGTDKATVAVQHERLPDPETAERLKIAWRGRLSVLKETLERG